MYDRNAYTDSTSQRTRTIHVVSGGVPSSSETTLEYIRHIEWFSGVNTPGYHQKVKRGELLPITAFTKGKDRGSQNFSYSLEYDDGESTYSQTTDWTTFDVLHPVSSGEISDAISPYLDQIEYYVQASAAKIYSSGWDALTFVVELRRTVSMFRDFVKNLLNNISSGRLENSWLEGRYGWRTLLYDIEDIQKALTSLSDKRTRFRESSGTQVSWDTFSSPVKTMGGAGSITFSQRTSYQIGLRGTVVADISPPLFAFNPVTTIWEATRLSFVIDWVFNVGQFLESLSFLALSQQYYAGGGYQVLAERNISVGSTSPNQYWNISVSGDAQYNYDLVLRTPMSVSTKPLFNLRLDELKVADLLALLLQQLRR